MLSDWQVLAGGDHDAEPEPEPAPLLAKVVSAAEARQALERASGFRKAARVVLERQEVEDEAAAQQTWQQQKQTARQSWREEADAVDAVCAETYKAAAFAQAVSAGQSRADWHGHAVAVAKGTKVKVLSMEDAQWWKVLVISADSAERRKGFVPASCLRLVEPKAKKPQPQRPASTASSSSSEPQSAGGGGAACDAQREPARRTQRRLYGRKKVQPRRRA